MSDAAQLIANPEAPAEVLSFQIIYLNPRDLKPYWRNTKKHSRAQVAALAKVIRAVGFDQPIVVDADHVIIKGHGRRLAAMNLGLDMVPVVVRDDLTPEQVNASRIVDNKTQTMTAVDTDAEKVEVDVYTDMGGTLAADFFDFMPAAKEKQAPAAKVDTKPTKTLSVQGTLQVCPKCSNSFLEVPK